MTWLNDSRFIEHLEVEICFQLNDSFFIGDPNNVEQLYDEAYFESLVLPSFDRKLKSIASTREALSHELALANYYKALVEKAVFLDEDFNEIRHYFWLRLWF